jgi:hypothetical protein
MSAALGPTGLNLNSLSTSDETPSPRVNELIKRELGDCSAAS